ncbi:hypothetical protein [Paenibacillus sp. DMB5]|uniref:hypothetical protein n=1 Tax=Paenibacillus sp. DMB5 TaxID=1780103 RepID=UPI00076C89B4|nr:hypothetical protein [Paenibacillus sp. DMB5]KUP24898.1 hypothetical protein AWJ19_03150 [Paenibacillus sp. DMB5]
MQQAIDKLQKEMEASKHPYVKVVGEHVLKVLQVNPAAAEKVLTDGKTIAGALSAMKSEAMKTKFEGMGMLSDEDGYAIALKYYGFDGNMAVPASAAPAPVTAAPVPPVTPAAGPPAFDLGLDDLLGGL